MNNKKKFGLALGSGGLRGLFHLGVLKTLEKENIKIDYIAGSSIGALIGAMIASGQSYQEILDKVTNNKSEILLSFLDPVIFKGGMLRGRKLKKLVEKFIDINNFKDLEIPLSVVATDLVSGKAIVLNEGDLISAVMASMAIPGIFRPIHMNEMVLVDGGVTNPVPDNVARNMGAEVILASNLDYSLHRAKNVKDYKLAINVGLRSIDLIRHYLAEHSVNSADVVLNPEMEENSLIGISTLLLNEKSEKLINLGEKVMQEKIESLNKLLC